MTYTLAVDYDPDCANPLEDEGSEGFKLVHFNPRFSSYECPWGTYLRESGDDRTGDFPPCLWLRNKLRAATAWFFSLYDHGLLHYSLQGEGPQCRWDTCQLAGVLLDPAQRTAAARLTLQEYTRWANGECYGYTLEGPDGDTLDSCRGLIGWDYLQETVAAEVLPLVPRDAHLVLAGMAGDLSLPPRATWGTAA